MSSHCTPEAILGQPHRDVKGRRPSNFAPNNAHGLRSGFSCVLKNTRVGIDESPNNLKDYDLL